MAAAVKERRFTTYGNVAYDPAYAPGEDVRTRQEPLVRPRERVESRERVRLRPAGYVAPTAVIGFVLVAALAIAIIASYVEIAVGSNQVIHLRNEHAALTETHNKLLADYELAFDLKTVEEAVTASGAMVQPQPGQLIDLALAEPDSVSFYAQKAGPLEGLWNDLKTSVENVVAFFR